MDFQQLVGYNNQGYRILRAEVYEQKNGVIDGICLGVNAHGTMYVTWDFRIHPGMAPSFETGHYIDEQSKALADYHERLMNKYGNWRYRPLSVAYNL